MARTEMIRNFLRKRWVRIFLILLVLIFLLYLFRNPILKKIGNWLASGDELQRTEAVFVLGGNSYERGIEASIVYTHFPGTPIIATGANVPLQLMAFDTVMMEAELTRMLMIKNGVPDSLSIALCSGTSTKEESDAILVYCEERGLKDITVISSSFHLRRVRWVFEDYFEEKGVTVYFHGAASKDFDPDSWWHSEEGLITVNNEIMKLAYYFFKY
jgi:uncharacterized SAM-binding protein YcdF (DUF218 family)